MIPFGDDVPSCIPWNSGSFPVRHVAEALPAGFLGGPFSGTDVLVVAAWGMTDRLLADRTFSGNRT